MEVMEGLVNLCLEPFVANVECSSVCRDGYPATNLISTDPEIRNKGFRVAHFIRPPVTITLNFKWAVNIGSILIKPTLDVDADLRLVVDGSHLSEVNNDYQYSLHSGGLVARGPGALIHLRNRVLNKKQQTKNGFPGDTVAMVKGTHVKSCDVERSKVLEQPLKHINIASRLRQLRINVTRLTGVKPFVLNWIEVWGTQASDCRLLELEAFQTAVQNIHLCAHSNKPKINLYSNHDSDQDEQETPQDHIHKDAQSVHAEATELYTSRVESVYRCSAESSPDHRSSLNSLNIKYKKPSDRHHKTATKRGISSPGATSIDCPSSKRQRIKESCSPVDSLYPPNLTRADGGHLQQTVGRNTRHTNKLNSIRELAFTGIHHSNATINIPTKFLDSITHEYMVIPMILPSGHYVDRSTVEKLASNDTLYGRAPTDPFTGVAFTEHSKPEFSPELKADLDNYLTTGNDSFLEHGSPLTSSRSIGSASDISRHLIRGITSSRPNDRAHPVLEIAASSGCSSQGGPLKQSTSLQQSGYEDSTQRLKDNDDLKERKLDNRISDANEGSFESKISCSLDVALNQLFSNNY